MQLFDRKKDFKYSENFNLLKMLIEVNEKILTATPYENILSFMYDSLNTEIPFDRISVALLEKDKEETRLQMNWVKSKKESEHLKLPYSTNSISPSLKKILDSNQPRILNDLVTYLDENPNSISTQLAIKEGIRSSLACPLRIDGKPIGIIFFSSFLPGTYRHEHVEIFQQIATEVSVIIYNGMLQRCFDYSEVQTRNVNMTLHDLRSPLGILQGFAELSLDQPWFKKLEPEAALVFQTFFRNTKYMIQLVDELNELIEIRKGLEACDFKSNNLPNFLSEIVQNGQQLANQKEIVFKYYFSPQLPREAFFDSHKIKRVLLNLISNAVKFSNRKSEIILRVEQMDNKLVFSVEDQGQGIPKNEFGKLFQEFGKTSVKPTEGETSTGQGLAIAKKFIDHHSGQISVSSHTGIGSTFSFWIPMNAPDSLKIVPSQNNLS
jgi:signal transduction histidine kinase